jgi:hypothetical protein
MRIRGIVSAIVGLAQSAIGVLAAAWTVMLFLGMLEVQTVFDVPPELMPFYLLILSLFSLFSIISGILLIRELRR